MSAGSGSKKRVLIIGGTRFSGLYLWKELYDRVWKWAGLIDSIVLGGGGVVCVGWGGVCVGG